MRSRQGERWRRMAGGQTTPSSASLSDADAALRGLRAERTRAPSGGSAAITRARGLSVAAIASCSLCPDEFSGKTLARRAKLGGRSLHRCDFIAPLSEFQPRARGVGAARLRREGWRRHVHAGRRNSARLWHRALYWISRRGSSRALRNGGAWAPFGCPGNRAAGRRFCRRSTFASRARGGGPSTAGSSASGRACARV